MLLKMYLVFTIICLLYFRIRKVKTAEQALMRALTWVKLYRKDKALAYLIKSVDLMKDDKEKASLFKMIGMRYYRKKEYSKAVHYFNQSFEIALLLKFYYNSELHHVLMAYLHLNQKDRAKELYYNFLERCTYDKKFNKLKKLEGYF